MDGLYQCVVCGLVCPIKIHLFNLIIHPARPVDRTSPNASDYSDNNNNNLQPLGISPREKMFDKFLTNSTISPIELDLTLTGSTWCLQKNSLSQRKHFFLPPGFFTDAVRRHSVKGSRQRYQLCFFSPANAIGKKTLGDFIFPFHTFDSGCVSHKHHPGRWCAWW